jgi:hypothetical protein
MPCPFSPQSRVRSKWIDTGRSQREYLTPGSTGTSDPYSQTFQFERRIAEANGAVLGPIYEFDGIDEDGYVEFTPNGQTAVQIVYPIAFPPQPPPPQPPTSVAIASIASDASYLGKPAYKITLATGGLGEVNRYAAYEGELLNNSTPPSVLAGFRILSHTDTELLLDPTAGALPINATRFWVRSKFFKIITNGTEGLGPVVTGTSPVPLANLRIGFAFHNNPQDGLGGRFPTKEQDWLYDLDDPVFVEWISQQPPLGRNRHPRYVQWDVIFDIDRTGQGLKPSTPRPELHFLRLPFRF